MFVTNHSFHYYKIQAFLSRNPKGNNLHKSLHAQNIILKSNFKLFFLSCTNRIQPQKKHYYTFLVNLFTLTSLVFHISFHNHLNVSCGFQAYKSKSQMHKLDKTAKFSGLPFLQHLAILTPIKLVKVHTLSVIIHSNPSREQNNTRLLKKMKCG